MIILGIVPSQIKAIGSMRRFLQLKHVCTIRVNRIDLAELTEILWSLNSVSDWTTERNIMNNGVLRDNKQNTQKTPFEQIQLFVHNIVA